MRPEGRNLGRKLPTVWRWVFPDMVSTLAAPHARQADASAFWNCQPRALGGSYRAHLTNHAERATASGRPYGVTVSPVAREAPRKNCTYDYRKPERLVGVHGRPSR